MPKRKYPSRISTRYRRRLIREESDELFPLICNNEEPRTNSRVIKNNSVLNNDNDEILHANFNNALSAFVQETTNLSFSEETNIFESDTSLNNTLVRTFIIEDDNNNNLEKENNDFEAFLIQWAITHHISHVALSHLLSGLKKVHPIFFNLPKCAKTLLRTPRSSVITDMFPGQYCHIGIEYGILQFLSASNGMNNSTVLSSIKIQIGIDGLPISRSNSNQLWPILGRIMPHRKVFLIGCYFGKTKPADANEFLKQFVKDINVLIDKGVTYNKTTFPVSIHSIICDAPAKSFITLTKGHTGYFSCSKCTIEGEFIANRICFPGFDWQKRTDVSFRNQIQEEYHLGRSILLNISNFDIVSQIPLDYMKMSDRGFIVVEFSDGIQVILKSGYK
ncbi:uncharacterized protein LOC114940024, partial [Nylanderia fulva]|uniref:uncharacterized protein LOC114940024 n=1 Tax=Nylanderia fulva TaxID=613905 RepID=UPI0010FB5891